jgi:pimeloyl-ACP methyl ester carboxylesterase
MSSTVQVSTDIRPFSIESHEEKVDDLRRRIAATRWPSKELVADRSQGVRLEALQALARYWGSEYDFGRVAARLSALPQFVTEIDGVDVHFIHVRSTSDDAQPLIMTHGWPGSVIELLDTIGPLTDPTSHGGGGADAFHLVLPSLPGYGLSAEPMEVGWDLGRTARAWAELMRRLGYSRYVAQGGDVGAGVTDAMQRQQPAGLIGVHTNLLVPALNGPMPTDTDEERAAAAQIATFQRSGNGYFVEMATRPQTIGYALLDSPIALAAWMVDHDTDAYYKIAAAFVDGQPSGNLTRDHVLDNITLYWLTGTGASAARSYWEASGNLTRDHVLDNITLYWLTGTGASAARSYWEAYGPDAPAAGSQPLPASAIPFAFTTFPGEIWRTPRSWVDASYPNVVYFNAVDKGGHFAAWEEPEIFSSELRDGFRLLR